MSALTTNFLKTSFDELQSSYNVIQQQEKNSEIVKQNEAEQGQVLNEFIPAEELADEETEEKKMSDFLKKTIHQTGRNAIV